MFVTGLVVRGQTSFVFVHIIMIQFDSCFFLALSLCILTPREPFEPVSSCVRHSENFMDSVRAIVGCWSSLDEQGRSSLRVQISRQFWQVRLVVHLQQSAQIASSIYPLKDEGCTDWRAHARSLVSGSKRGPTLYQLHIQITLSMLADSRPY